uniref:Zinc finger protein 319 n=1 Tax=Anthurium amnicola TaxID=1678845 RepID=A0A1D1YC57_9ARAE
MSTDPTMPTARLQRRPPVVGTATFPVPVLLLLAAIAALVPSCAAWRPWPPTALLNLTASGAAPPTALDVGGSKRYEGSSEFVQLRYHMGPVLAANITVHIIWYGAGWSRPQKRTIRAFLRSLSDESAPHPSVAGWWRTVRLYTDQTGANVTARVALGPERTDRRCSHGRLLTRLSVQHVIRAAVTAPRRPLPVNPRGGLYLLLTSSDVAVQDFCAGSCGFHYFTFPSIVGYTLPYAWIGNSAARCPGSCAYPFAIPDYFLPPAPGGKKRQPAPAPNGDPGVDGMVSVIGHELAEMATNPLVNAWYAGADPSFPTEIADLCEGIYGTGGGGAYTGQVTVDGRDGAWYNLHGSGGRRFLVQWVWHPHLGYCFGPNALDQ